MSKYTGTEKEILAALADLSLAHGPVELRITTEGTDGDLIPEFVIIKAPEGKRARQDCINAEWAALARACKGCIYFTAGRCCDYIGIVGHRRPCPPGPGCTVKTTGDRRRKVDYGKVEDL